MNKVYTIEIYGKKKKWSFHIEGNDKYWEEWIADGLEVNKLVNTIPENLPNTFIPFWCFMQDLFHFKWFRR